MRIGLAVFSTVIAIYTAEIILARIAHETRTWGKVHPPPFDQRNKVEVRDDPRRAGIAAELIVTPKQFVAADGLDVGDDRLQPLGAISRTTTVLCNESGTFVVYESDRNGFNNPDSAWDGAPVDFLVVGDSFAHGYCVQPGDDVAGQLRRRGHSAVNLGTAGAGPWLTLAALKEYGPALRPRQILWLYFEENDLINLYEERESTILARYAHEPDYRQGLAARQKEIDRAIVNYVERKRSKLDNRRPGRWLGPVALEHIAKLEELRWRFTPNPRQLIDRAAQLPEFRLALIEARRVAKTWGGNLTFVYLPDYSRYHLPESGERFYLREDVLESVDRLGIPIVDVHEIFVADGDPFRFFPYRHWGHYNADGYQTIAEAVLGRPLLPTAGNPYR